MARGDAAAPSLPTALPLPVGAPLLLALIGVLATDRLLGLTRFALTPTVDARAVVLVDPPLLYVGDLVAALVVLTVLLVMRSIERSRRRGGLIATVLVDALVGLQVGARVAGTAAGTDLPADAYLARALLLTGAAVTSRLILASLEEHRATVVASVASRSRSEALARTGKEALARLRQDATARVRAVLDDALRSVAASEGPGAGERLRALADDVVRPLSHRLAAAPSIRIDVDPSVPPLRWRDTLADVVRTPVVPARTLAVVATSLAFLRTLVTEQDAVRGLVPAVPPATGGLTIAVSIDWPVLGASFADLGLVLGVTWWGAARLSRAVTRRSGPPSGAVGAWAVTLIALGGIAALTAFGSALVGVLVDLPRGDGLAPPAWLALLASFLPMLAVTLGATTVRAVDAARGALDADSARNADAAARTAARVQAVLGHEQRRLARSLHADVQSAVNAAGIALDRADRRGAVTSELVDEVVGRIAAAIERFLASGPSDRTLRDRLQDVERLWAGVCAVVFDVDGDVAPRVDADPIARELIVDLIAEACANAVVHGGAARVDVRIDLTHDDEVMLDVRDDGTRRQGPTRAGGEGQRGLGSAMLRASCTRFGLDLQADGAVLTATVPLG